MLDNFVPEEAKIVCRNCGQEGPNLGHYIFRGNGDQGGVNFPPLQGFFCSACIRDLRDQHPILKSSLTCTICKTISNDVIGFRPKGAFMGNASFSLCKKCFPRELNACDFCNLISNDLEEFSSNKSGRYGLALCDTCRKNVFFI